MRHSLGIGTLGILIALGALAGLAEAEPPGLPGPPRVYAIEGAHIVPAPGEEIDSGTVVIRDGLIEAVGADATTPPDAVVIDADGLWVYPGLIDIAIDLAPEKKAGAGPRRSDPAPPEPGPRPGAVHRLAKVHPETRAVEELVPFDGDRKKTLEGYLELGFTTGLVAPRSGIFRGSSVVVQLRDDTPVSEMILLEDAAQHLSFERGRYGEGYPTSLMGAAATVRQVVLDARRHAVWAERHRSSSGGMKRPESVAAFEALGPLIAGDQPAVFHVESPADVLLADRLSDELGLRGVVHGSGHEWEIAGQIASTDRELILPVAFPEKPEVGEDDAALDVSRRDMRRYLEAPAAAARLHDAGVTFALTTNGLKKPADLKRNIRKMLDAGLSKDVALAALTTVPARMVGLEGVVGTLEAGKVANVVVLDGPLFESETKRVFVDGREHRIGNKKEKPSEEKDSDEEAGRRAEASPLPDAGLRRVTPAFAPETVLLTGATIWTQGPQGRLEGADLLARGGKIVAVGPGLDVPDGAHVIDATGKHVTPGLIDTHGHVAVRGGVNEGSNNITAETRVKDVVDPEDVDIYRQLAGGLTCAHALHGSANSIGGQDAVLKLHWGATADDLVIPGRKGIKFAMGENPKRSRGAGRGGAARYPQTRMGVVESIRAAFLRARDYEKEWAAHDALAAAERERREPLRRDLQLEAISEVLSGERAVHCHAYRQDEMLAALRLAAEFDIPIATFEHGLEGYKIADELAAAGAGVTTFSDWWAYKLEAYDAIPHNGALMHDRGVLVTFNSDSAELARRLNLEAAKAVKYGGVDEEEALAFVTINAARQLGLDDRVGSLEEGKDADFVVWSGDPLSVYSVAEQTWVDGKREFDRAADLARRSQLEGERSALVSRVRAEDEKDSEKDEEEEAEEAPGAEPSAARSPSAEQRHPLPYSDRLAALGGAVSIVGATVHTMVGEPIENGTVSFDEGRIVAVGAGLAPLGGATVIDATGRHLYPGLIDANNVVGLTEISAVAASVDIAETGLVNANVNTAIAVNPDSEVIPVTRTGGITHVLVAPGGDLVRGTSALIRLDGWTWEDLTAATPVAMHLSWPSFAIQTESFFGPPRSREEQEKQREERLEKIRQVFSDARAYATARKAEEAGGRPLDADPVLEALRPVLDRRMPLIIYADEARQIRSAIEWADEEGVRMILAGSRDVWRVTDLLSARRIPVILTEVLALPSREDEPYDTPYAAAARLHEAGVPFCIAGAGNAFAAASARNLPHHAAMAAAFGLPREEALKALTLSPARILGVDDDLGSIETGKSASLILTDGDPLEIRTHVMRAFIDGREVDLPDNRHDRLYRRYAARPTVK